MSDDASGTLSRLAGSQRPKVVLVSHGWGGGVRRHVDELATALADRADVLLFLAIREAARQRLFGAVGWLGPQLLAYVEHYAREITIDPHALEQAIEIQLNSGDASATAWGCDLSEEYVRINAEYTT